MKVRAPTEARRLAALALLLIACWRDAVGPDFAPRARIAMIVEFEGGMASSIVPVASMRLRLHRLNGALALDTTIAITPEADSVDLTLTVPLILTAPSDPPMERIIVRSTLYGAAEDSVFSAGPDTVEVISGVLNPVGTSMRYVGVGFDAESVHVDPQSALETIGAALTFTATAYDSGGAAIANTPILWSTLEPTILTIAREDSGRVTTGPSSGAGRLVARTLTGQADTVTVTVLAPPAIVLSANTISFFASANDVDPAPQTVTITNGGGEPLTDLAAGPVQYTGAVGWLTATLDQTTAPATLTLETDPDSLTIGLHTATVTITSSVAENSPQQATVTLVVGEGRETALGAAHTCALDVTGAAYCWGSNLHGRLGDGTQTDRSTPTLVAGGLTFQSLAGGERHTCGVAVGGAAYCWGWNGAGALGDGSIIDRSAPVPVAGGHLFRSLSAGRAHACGVALSGATYCWGQNSASQLGDGTTTSRLTPVVAVGGHSFEVVSARVDHTCGLTAAGAAFCWGSNSFGKLGDGSAVDRSVPTEVLGGLAFRSIHPGGFHTCGNKADGTLYCWGLNLDGRLGDGSLVNRFTPVAVLGGLTFEQVSAGANHTCAVASGGSAYCWGNNAVGMLGDGGFETRAVPTVVLGGLSFEAVSAGTSHTCGRTSNGETHCWGDNARGQLGDGTVGFRDVPGDVIGGVQFQAVTAGDFHACGLSTAGAVYCWGMNAAGALGDGTTQSRSAPAAVAGGLVFQSVTAGLNHTCGLTTDGSAYCWGSNSVGQLGNGTVADAATTVAVSGGLTFQSLAASSGHTCGLDVSGVAYCWGENSLGQLGDGSTANRNEPTAVFGGLAFQSITAGRNHSCGVTTTGVAYCWGGNSPPGTLGIGVGTSGSYVAPTLVAGGHVFQTLSAGKDSRFTCGVTIAQAAYCWGTNSQFQVGDGTSVGRSSPVPVSGSHAFAMVGAGWIHACGMTVGGAAYCWGFNVNGELGDGQPPVAQSFPTPVFNGLNFVGLSVGARFTCGVRSTGTISCWGFDGWGALGSGIAAYRSQPVRVLGL